MSVWGLGKSHQPPHLGNGLLPPRASRKKDPGADKKQTELGKLRQLRGGRAGRQAGRLGKESLELGNAGAYCRGFSRLTLAPALEWQVGTLTGLAPPSQSSPGHALLPPTQFRSFGQGSRGWLWSLTRPPWAPRRHPPGKWDRSGWPSTTCQHTWHGTRGCRGGLGAVAAPRSH